jgi:hypothetical protein
VKRLPEHPVPSTESHRKFFSLDAVAPELLSSGCLTNLEFDAAARRIAVDDRQLHAELNTRPKAVPNNSRNTAMSHC